MARIRTIKPEYWTSEQVMSCSRDARLLFIGMWNFCDDGGNHPASAMTLKAEVLPGDSVSVVTVMQWVDELIEQGLLAEYDADGKEFWHVTGWSHQRIDQPTLRHPKGDTGDTQVTSGDTGHLKRVSGKQRQLIVKKIRERDGDTCASCGDTQGDTLFRFADLNPANPHDVRNYRLFCRSCKRKNGVGDTQVTGGDSEVTRGDTDGDTTTEGRVGEGNGVESISTLVEQQQASTVVGVSPAESDEVTHGDASPPGDTPNSSTPVSRAIEIAVYLRQRGVAGANSINPNIAEWADDVRVTNEILDAAISKARVSLKGKPLGPNYLATIIPDLLNPQPAQSVKREDNAWKRSDAGISRKASELGIVCPPGKDFAWLREKCESVLRQRAQAIPA